METRGRTDCALPTLCSSTCSAMIRFPPGGCVVYRRRGRVYACLAHFTIHALYKAHYIHKLCTMYVCYIHTAPLGQAQLRRCAGYRQPLYTFKASAHLAFPPPAASALSTISPAEALANDIHTASVHSEKEAEVDTLIDMHAQKTYSNDICTCRVRARDARGGEDIPPTRPYSTYSCIATRELGPGVPKHWCRYVGLLTGT